MHKNKLCIPCICLTSYSPLSSLSRTPFRFVHAKGHQAAVNPFHTEDSNKNHWMKWNARINLVSKWNSRFLRVELSFAHSVQQHTHTFRFIIPLQYAVEFSLCLFNLHFCYPFYIARPSCMHTETHTFFHTFRENWKYLQYFFSVSCLSRTCSVYVLLHFILFYCRMALIVTSTILAVYICYVPYGTWY